MNQNEKDRKKVKELSFEEMDDELQRPTGEWRKDVNREALRRILNSQNINFTNNHTQTLNNSISAAGSKNRPEVVTEEKSGNGTTFVQIAKENKE